MTESVTLTVEVAKVLDMLNKCSLDGDKEHDDLYLEVSDEGVIVLQSAPGEVVLTYGSYYPDYFESISFDGVDKLGAVIRVEQLEDYLSMVSDGGIIEMTFATEVEGDDLARFVDITGDLEARITLPGGGDMLSRIPDWLPERFTDDNIYTSSPESGSKELPTRIETTSDSVHRIINAKKKTNSKVYPIVVEEGSFRINIGTDAEYVRGSLDSANVTGPDVDNKYLAGFEEIFSVMSGRLLLQTAPDNGPLAVVQTGNDYVVRHVNTSVNLE